MRLRRWFPGFVVASLVVAGCNNGSGSTQASRGGAPTFPPSTTAPVTVSAARASATFAPIAGRLSRPGVAHPHSIVAGPDGALWFTNSNLGVPTNGHNAIGRITTSGVVTEYPLSPSSSPFSITAGPDGALWFTEANTGKVGRLSLPAR